MLPENPGAQYPLGSTATLERSAALGDSPISEDLEARRERPELPAIDRELLASLVDQFEKELAAGTRVKEKDLLHRVVKKVLIKDRHTVEVWYGLPNRGAIESWNNWLPGQEIARTARAFVHALIAA